MPKHGANAARNHAGAQAMARCRAAKEAAAVRLAEARRLYDLAVQYHDEEITRATDRLMAELAALEAE